MWGRKTEGGGEVGRGRLELGGDCDEVYGGGCGEERRREEEEEEEAVKRNN